MNIPLAMVLTVIIHQKLGEGYKRDKRYLVYSLNGSKLQLIFGTGLPIHVENISATIGWVLKSAYMVPTNSSIYTNPYVSFEKKRSVIVRSFSRFDLYRAFEKRILSSRANGKYCLLKAICEASKIPFRGTGLLGQLFSVFFLPSTTEEQPEKKLDKVYHLAERHGKNKEDCNIIYPNCHFHLVDLLTVVKAI